MTEDEAKSKHCPVMHGHFFAVEGQAPAAAPKCIGSACMMFVKRDVRVIKKGTALIESTREECHCGLLRQVW